MMKKEDKLLLLQNKKQTLVLIANANLIIMLTFLAIATPLLLQQ